MHERRYITTAIDYPNAPPHMGHVLEKVLADVCARWFRMCGDHVRFQIGTDEHGIKIQRAAEAKEISPHELVDSTVPLFQDLYKRLGISADVFIRTSDKETHWPTVRALWEKLRDAGMLEKRSYTGLYCSGCERFMTKRDLNEEGLCPNHLVAPETVTEENWFFLLSKMQDGLRQLLTAQWDGEQYRIEPSFRANETLALLDQGLEDVSFSRPRSSLSWGVPVPDDQDQMMYVWCDALTNYISGLGFYTDHEEKEWWDTAEVTHVIGKDIARFHALIWPAMLRTAEIRCPDRLLMHGFLTSEGQKMSKSLGNVVVPDDVLTRFGGNPDPLRFYLSYEVPLGRDGDFSWERFEKLYDSKLRNQLGNLLNRTLVLLKKHESVLDIPSTDPFGMDERWKTYEEAMNSFALSDAIAVAFEACAAGDKFIDEHQPWKADPAEAKQALGALAELLRHVSLFLLPFMPATAKNIAEQLAVPYSEDMALQAFVATQEHRTWGSLRNDWKRVGDASILFAPLS